MVRSALGGAVGYKIALSRQGAQSRAQPSLLSLDGIQLSVLFGAQKWAPARLRVTAKVCHAIPLALAMAMQRASGIFS